MNPVTLSRLLAVVTVVVTLAWLISFLAPLARPDYQPPQEIHIVMMAVVGVLVNLSMKASKAETPKDKEEKE